jgi:opacity protein-like surface antigen
MTRRVDTKPSTSLSIALMLAMALSASFVLAQETAGTPEQGSPPATAPAGPDYGGARPGFYLALGWVGTHLSLDDEAQQAFEDAGISFDPQGRGAQFQMGYAFNEVFALELQFTGLNHDADIEDVEVTSGFAQLEAVTNLVTHGHVRPYLAGGIGGAAVEAGGTRIDGGQVTAGGGLEIHVSRRFALAFHYRYAIQNYETATLQLDETLREEIELDASGHSHIYGLRLAFSF